jgi:hypothetical protein
VERSLCGCSFLEMFFDKPKQKSRLANHATRLLLNVELESECQRHLYLPGTADGMGYIAKAGRAVVEAGVGLVAR